MSDLVIRHPLSRDALEVVADPDALHRFVMRLLPDLGGVSAAIRADTGTLFRVDLPADRLGTPAMVTLRVRSAALAPHVTGEMVDARPPQVGDRFVVKVAAARRKTRPGPGMDITPVADDAAMEWASDLLGRHGLVVGEVAVSPARSFGRTGGVKYTLRDVTATLTATTTPDAAKAAFTLGVGHGRAYGLGMIITLPATLSPSRS